MRGGEWDRAGERTLIPRGGVASAPADAEKKSVSVRQLSLIKVPKVFSLDTSARARWDKTFVVLLLLQTTCRKEKKSFGNAFRIDLAS